MKIEFLKKSINSLELAKNQPVCLKLAPKGMNKTKYRKRMSMSSFF